MNNNKVEDREDQILDSEQFCANCNVQNCSFRNLPFRNDLKLWVKQFINTALFLNADEKEKIFNQIIKKLSPLAKQFLILEEILSLDGLLKKISTQYEQLFDSLSSLSEVGFLVDFVKILFDIAANSKALLIDSGVEDNNSFIRLDNYDSFHESASPVNTFSSSNGGSEKCFSLENFSELDKQNMFKSVLFQLDPRSKNIVKRLQIKHLEDFLRLTEEDILTVRNAGVKTVRRILALICQIKKNGKDFTYETPSKDSSEYQRKIVEYTRADFQIPFENEILSDYYSKMDRRSRTVLKQNGLVSAKEILLLTSAKIMTFKNAGQLTANRLIKSQKNLLNLIDLRLKNVHTAIAKNDFPEFITLESQRKCFDNFLQCLSERAKNVLVKNGFSSYDSLRKIDYVSIMSLKNAGKKTAEEIIAVLERLKTNPDEFSENSIYNDLNEVNVKYSKDLFQFSDPISSIEKWIESRIKNSSHRIMIFHRCGLGAKKTETLEAVGLLAGVTRERVRQVCINVCKKLAHPAARKEISSLIIRGNEIIRAFRNNIDFVTFLSLLFKDNAAAIEFFKYSESFFAILFPKTFGSKRSLSNNQVAIFPKPFIEFVVKTCRQNSLCKTLGENFWLLPIDLLEERMEQNLEMAKELFPEYTNTRTTTMALVAAAKEIIAVRDGYIFSAAYFKVKFGKLHIACESLLLAFLNGVHYTKFAEYLNEIRSPNRPISERNIHSSLTLINSSFLIGRGTFIHSNYLPNPKILLIEIENCILDYLEKSSHPFVSITKFYEAFQGKLAEAGINSEYMLYFLLKRFSEKLVFAKCPYLYLKKGYEGRVMLTDLIETFFYEAGGPLDYKFIETELIEAVGISQLQFDLIRPRLPQIVKVGQTMYSHINHIEFDIEKLKQVIEYASSVVVKEGYVSIEKIFQEKIILCKSGGIDNPYSLFHLMRYFKQTDGLTVPFKTVDYPHISQEYGQNNGFSIKECLNDFIRDFGAPCPMKEIILNFKKRRGVKENTLNNTFYQIPSVVRYDSNSYIHLEVIGWNNASEEKLKEVALECFTRESRLGNAFGRISLLIEEIDYKLPLGNDCAWTNFLLFELLKRNKGFIILGTGREAFVTKDNNLRIKTITDLVAYYLKTRFNGASSLPELEEFLRKERIILKRIPKEIFDDNDSIVIRNDQVFLKELYECLGT